MVIVSFPILTLLIPIILLIWYIFFREKIGVIYPNFLIWKYLKTPKRIWVLWFLRSIWVASLVFIIAGLSIAQTKISQVKIPQDIMIVFDISLSMLAEDISPSRIEVARNIVQNFISSRKEDRIGLIIFAWKPFISIPFSSDYRGISSIVSGLSPYLIRQDLPGLSGTNIGDALLLANMAYSGSQSASKSIVLLTDGRANIGIDPTISAKESAEQGIQIYSIWVGSIKGWDLFYTDSNGQKNYFYDASGNILQSDLDEPMMKNISQITQGKYFQWDNRIELEKVFSDIEKTIPNVTENKVENKIIDMTPVLIVLCIIFLIIERLYLKYVMKKYWLI